MAMGRNQPIVVPFLGMKTTPPPLMTLLEKTERLVVHHWAIGTHSHVTQPLPPISMSHSRACPKAATDVEAGLNVGRTLQEYVVCSETG